MCFLSLVLELYYYRNSDCRNLVWHFLHLKRYDFSLKLQPVTININFLLASNSQKLTKSLYPVRVLLSMVFYFWLSNARVSRRLSKLSLKLPPILNPNSLIGTLVPLALLAFHEIENRLQQFPLISTTPIYKYYHNLWVLDY